MPASTPLLHSRLVTRSIIVNAFKKLGHLCVGLLTLCYFVSAAWSQPGDIDSTFTSSVGGEVDAIAVQADGKTLVGGLFSYFSSPGGLVVRYHLARLQADGSLDLAFDAQLNNNGYVRTIAIQDDGKILIGGLFTTVGGQSRHGLARLNADGTLDATFNVAMDGYVNAIAVQPDGAIIIVGGFANVAGQARTNVARLLANGTLESAFNAPIVYADSSEVDALAVQEDGKIVIGGYFTTTTVQGQTHTNLARLNANGSLDTTFDAGPILGHYGSYDGTVHAVALQSDGRILIGGFFRTIAGQTRNAIARLQTTGSLDSVFDPNVTGAGDSTYVHTILVHADGKIVIGGEFGLVGATQRARCARITSSGSLDATFVPSLYNFSGLASRGDGRLLAAASFNADPARHFGKLLNDSATDSLTAVGTNQVKWLRGATAPETQSVKFSLSTDFGASWTAVGSGTRITGGWRKTGATLPATGLLRAQARIVNGSSGLVETIVSFPDDTTTQPPILVLPYAGATQTRGSIVTYTLHEAAQTKTVKVRYRYTGQSTMVRLMMSPDGETAGTHSFVLDPANPTSSSAVATGGPIPDGSYVVDVIYNDLLGNGLVASAQAQNVTVDTVTLAPALQHPAPNETSGKLMKVNFTLPEPALQLSAKVKFTGPVTSIVTLNPSQAVQGTNSFTLDTSDLSLSANVSSVSGVSQLPPGRYAVAIEYQDVLSNPSISVTSTNVLLDPVGPLGGTMVLSPASPVDLQAPLTVTFSGWSGQNLPLTYAVLMDSTVVSAAGPTTSRNFVAPSYFGTRTLKGQITDSLGNVTEVTQLFDVLSAPESWRRQYFGVTANEGAAADDADPDGDGSNRFEYIAGTDPTNSASHFSVRVEIVPGQPGQKKIIFSPRLADRTYTVKYKTQLRQFSWVPLSNFTTSDNGTERTIIDLNAGTGTRCYVVEISRP